MLYTHSNGIGGLSPGHITNFTPNAHIIIGDDIGISGGSFCAAKKVEIGALSMLGALVTIYDTDFHDFSKIDRRYLGISLV